MRKDELLKLRTLNATPKMMQMAEKDNLETRKIKQWGYESSHKCYKIGCYMRCQQLGEILKVALFLPNIMRNGCDKPTFEIFINRQAEWFITYDCQNKKWLTAKIDMLPIPQPRAYWGYQGEVWINQEGRSTIKNLLKTEKGGFDGILEYQRSIRELEIVRRNKRITDPWDEDLKQIPPVPKDWVNWTQKVGITEQFIFYEYGKGNPTSGWCTYCEKQVPIREPRHNKEGSCPCCRHKITFKADKKAGVVNTKSANMYLIQRCKDGFVIRQFNASARYRPGARQNPETCNWEIRRVIYEGKSRRNYVWEDFKQRGLRWCLQDSYRCCWAVPGKVYGKTMPSLGRHELSRTGLPEVVANSNEVDPEYYIDALSRHPALERIAKAGLYRLALEYAAHPECCKNAFADCGDLAKYLGIDKHLMSRLRESHGGILYLKWLRFEKKSAKAVPDEVIKWFEKNQIYPDTVEFIMGKMSGLQVYHYISRQMAENEKPAKDVVREWKDYMSMAKRLHMDTNDAIVYRVKKLFQRHDELVALVAKKDAQEEIRNLQKKFPGVDKICAAVKAKYEYIGEKYRIVAPDGIGDIIAEGRTLHHCVGSSERYFDRIQSHEAYILFLRKVENPNVPYYTLEIEPGGTVRQKRTSYDRQNSDIKDAEKFLQKWQKEIQSRMNQNDMQLAEVSRKKRLDEFIELEKSNTVIRAGELAGSRLVDVLKKDIMEIMTKVG